MHIPDGYLSPETCAALYAAAAPFWYVALRRVRRMLNARVVPTLSLFAALSFVIMMFNLPLPGGTTGHAIGVGIAAIVLGPWASIITISVALLIQAVLFGDGGVTAFGANSLNMAVVGSLVASGVYRLLSARAPLVSTRRVVAAGVAGYAAINAAALCAGVEFGLQPRFFHDAAGGPLYAPYPLSVAVPAMLIGHLTFAGLAEMFITAGVVAYLQRTDSALLRLNTRAAAGSVEVARQSIWNAARPLWLALAALLILTPLGLLAAGTAWGEWGPRDFSYTQARAQIASASGNQAPPAQAPAGLERLSHLWSAPMPDYAPPFLKSAAFGYLMSALFGAGLIILFFLLLGRLARAARGVG
jgi:cobalt/nickel transport system permease protein